MSIHIERILSSRPILFLTPTSILEHKADWAKFSKGKDTYTTGFLRGIAKERGKDRLVDGCEEEIAAKERAIFSHTATYGKVSAELRRRRHSHLPWRRPIAQS